MALKDIREVVVPLMLDRERTLKFDLNAFAELEEKFGNMDNAFLQMQSGSMKAARAMLWAGLLHEDPNLTEREVGGLVTLSNIDAVMTRITEAISEAVPGAEAEPDRPAGKSANPTKKS